MARDLRQCVTPAAMDSWLLALDRYGTMSLAEILADPIDLCENGYVMYDLLATAVRARRQVPRVAGLVEGGSCGTASRSALASW